MIHICNWLLTRRCNLSCSYCGIARDKEDNPSCYPNLKYYQQNEMSTNFIISRLKEFKEHNPNCFHIFYGGEPFLRSDLCDIINFCNNEKILYTIISNNTAPIRRHIKNEFMPYIKNSKIQGFTSSVDPVIFDKNNISDDIKKKSEMGIDGLMEINKHCKDLVAEITITNQNKKYLYDTVSFLTDKGINSSITVVDNSKTVYYDFSNIYDDNILINKDKELENTFNQIINNKLNVHMPDVILPQLLNSLPSDFDCGFEKSLHNITIDADGLLRLCLRIRGNTNISSENLFINHGQINPTVETNISWNKKEYCRKCNWTCVIMSKSLENDLTLNKDLVHSKIREE